MKFRYQENNRSYFLVEQLASSSQLVLTTESVNALRRFEVEMIEYHAIEGILRSKRHDHDPQKTIVYETNGMIPLRNYLENIPKNDIFWIDRVKEILGWISQILTIILHAKGFFLRESQFAYLLDLVYLDPPSGKIFLMYMPLEKELVHPIPLRKMLREMLCFAQNLSEKNDFEELTLNLLGFIELICTASIPQIIYHLKYFTFEKTNTPEPSVIFVENILPSIETLPGGTAAESNINMNKLGEKWTQGVEMESLKRFLMHPLTYFKTVRYKEQ